MKNHDSFNEIILKFIPQSLKLELFDHFMSVHSTPHRFKNGHVSLHSLELGRRIKQKLWEQLDQSSVTSSSYDEDRLVHVDVILSFGVFRDGN